MHPFAHLSWYHLLLDAGVFLPLYVDLGHRGRSCRIMCLLAGGAGALIGSLLFSSRIQTVGMRGLSGISYGLMAVWAMEMVFDRRQSRAFNVIGALLLGFLFFTIAWEHATGTHLLEFLLLDMVGTPIIGCHLGGVAGALTVYLMSRGVSLAARAE
ncbi:MAG: hypothetical protein A2Z34_08750 [Planctomycetes bacterium RBG_16_59_8]|nr:MAG: hypothetical protein A2Z34_08750 [Planctomycetes bacterium RBG_16_59_8]